MPLHATVTYDLNQGVTEAARNKFHAELRKQNFVRHKLTTLWTAAFTPSSTKEGAKAFTRKVVDNAASLAGIKAYEVLVVISDEPPTEWSHPGTLLTGGLLSSKLGLR